MGELNLDGKALPVVPGMGLPVTLKETLFNCQHGKPEGVLGGDRATGSSAQRTPRQAPSSAPRLKQIEQGAEAKVT